MDLIGSKYILNIPKDTFNAVRLCGTQYFFVIVRVYVNLHDGISVHEFQ